MPNTSTIPAQPVTDTERDHFIRLMARVLQAPAVSESIYDKIPGDTPKQKSVWLYETIMENQD